jgi:hypothetical protein
MPTKNGKKKKKRKRKKRRGAWLYPQLLQRLSHPLLLGQRHQFQHRHPRHPTQPRHHNHHLLVGSPASRAKPGTGQGTGRRLTRSPLRSPTPSVTVYWPGCPTSSATPAVNSILAAAMLECLRNRLGGVLRLVYGLRIAAHFQCERDLRPAKIREKKPAVSLRAG